MKDEVIEASANCRACTVVQGRCCTLSTCSLQKTLSSLSLLGIDVNVLEDIFLAFGFNSELPKRSVTVQHSLVNLSRGARLAVSRHLRYVLAVEGGDLFEKGRVHIEQGTLSNSTRAELPGGRAHRSSPANTQRTDSRIDEVPVIVALLDFPHG